MQSARAPMQVGTKLAGPEGALLPRGSDRRTFSDIGAGGVSPSHGPEEAPAVPIGSGYAALKAHLEIPSRQHRPAVAVKPAVHDSRWGKGVETEGDRDKRLRREKALVFAEECREKSRQVKRVKRPLHRATTALPLPHSTHQLYIFWYPGGTERRSSAATRGGTSGRPPAARGARAVP